MKLFSSLTLIFLTLAFIGQGCKTTGDENIPVTEGNGDYYGGIQDIDHKVAAEEIETVAMSLSQIDSEEFIIEAPSKEIANYVNSTSDSSCQFAKVNQCTDGKIETLFKNCATEKPNIIYSGFQSLQFSDLTCSMQSVDSSLTHKYLVLFKNSSNNNTSSVHTLAHNDYRNISFGGGEEIKHIAGGLEYNLKGRRVQTQWGKINLDFSQRTLVPMQFTGVRRTDVRSLNGSFETSHNNAKFVSNLSFESVKWEPQNCCHPVSGSIGLSFQGKINGSAKAKFLSCGVVEVEINNVAKQIDLSSCP